MSTNRTLRTPLTLGMVAVTAAFGLSACVPTAEPEPTGEETTQQSPTEEPATEAAATETPATETSTAEPTDESTEESAEPTEGASSDAKGAPSGGAAASGDTVDAAQMEGEPIEVVQGKGGDTVEVPEHDEPIVVVFENTSSDEFSHLYGTADDGQTLPGVETGQTNVVLVDPYEVGGGLSNETASWDIEGDAEETFEISFYELDAVPEAGAGDTIGADGFGLVHWSADEDAYLGVDFQGDGNFIVRGETTEDTGQGTQHVFNEIGSGQGGMEVGEGEYIIVVEADGEWSFEPMTEEEYDAIPGGQG